MRAGAGEPAGLGGPCCGESRRATVRTAGLQINGASASDACQLAYSAATAAPTMRPWL